MIRVSEWVWGVPTPGPVPTLERFLNEIPGRVIAVVAGEVEQVMLESHVYGLRGVYEVVWEERG